MRINNITAKLRKNQNIKNKYSLENKLMNVESKLAETEKELTEANNNYKSLVGQSTFDKYWSRIATTSAVVLGLTAAYLGFFKDSSNLDNETQINPPTRLESSTNGKSKPPYFWGAITDNVIFEDDNALDMKGYARLGKQIYDMDEYSYQSDLNETWFTIPDDITDNNCSFEVWAIDRNGNESSKVRLYSYEGYISKTEIPR